MKVKKWKLRTISLLIVVLLGVGIIEKAVYAEDAQPTYYTVTDYSSFRNAIELAQDGDVITMMGAVTISSDFQVGSSEKHLTIQKHTSDSYINFNSGQMTFQNVTFDGGGVSSSNAFIMISTGATFDDCVFQNCGDGQNLGSSGSIGGAVRITTGTSQFTNCKFKDNYALAGGHMTINDAVVDLVGCTLVNGGAVSNGGAIYITTDTGMCNVKSSTITGNQAGDVGGGISNTGILKIDQSKIFGNVATNGGADICNKVFGRMTMNDTIEQLVELFKPDNILPISWVNDYDFDTSMYIPDVDPSAENALLKLNYEVITPTESETEEATENPTETPTPSEPSTEESTEQPSEPSTQEPNTEQGTETPSTEEPGTESPSNQSPEPSTPSDADNSQGNSTVTNTDSSTTNTSTSINTDNSSGDSSVSNVTNNNTTNNNSTENNNNTSTNNNISTDNSDKSNKTEHNESTNNSTVNNYYTTQSPVSDQVQKSEKNTVVVVPDSSDHVITYPSTNAPTASEESIGLNNNQADYSAAPNIQIDAKGVDVVFGYSETGGYNISITASKSDQDNTKEKVPVNWFDIIQILLLGAILICLIWKPKNERVKK